jgi:hypothetical protein
MPKLPNNTPLVEWFDRPMMQYSTFQRDDILNTLEFIRNAMSRMEQQIVYMEEQGLGRRDNLDWEDTAARIRAYYEDVRKAMGRFGTEVSFEPDNITYLENKTREQLKAELHKAEEDDLPF